MEPKALWSNLRDSELILPPFFLAAHLLKSFTLQRLRTYHFHLFLVMHSALPPAVDCVVWIADEFVWCVPFCEGSLDK